VKYETGQLASNLGGYSAVSLGLCNNWLT